MCKENKKKHRTLCSRSNTRVCIISHFNINTMSREIHEALDLENLKEEYESAFDCGDIGKAEEIINKASELGYDIL